MRMFLILTLICFALLALVGCEVERQYIYQGRTSTRDIDTNNFTEDTIKVVDLWTKEQKSLPGIYQWYLLRLEVGDTITFFPKRWMVYKSSEDRYVLSKKEMECGCALSLWKITNY
jgi:hypothetical protein